MAARIWQVAKDIKWVSGFATGIGVGIGLTTMYFAIKYGIH